MYLLLLFFVRSWFGTLVATEDVAESNPGGGGSLTFPEDAWFHVELRFPEVFPVSEGPSCFSISLICCSILFMEDCA